MSRKALIAANWKMYKTPAEAKAFVDAFLPLVAGHDRDEIALFPSPVLLPTVTAACNASNVAVGAQNIHFAEEGAYTGETSVGQLLAVGGTHTLIGHSERRQYFAETDAIVNKKLHTALKHSVIPIVCVGEVLAEREANLTADVLKTQITGAFTGITAEAAAPIVIAYEPVWAIGTGKTAEVAKLLGTDVAAAMRILYGGSVKPDNATALMGQEEIDGALVGGASLKPDSFTAIVKY
jgi:triosephosphate isomerase